MKHPPLLLGAALLFWGWQTGFLVVAFLLAAALEGARHLPLRWELEEKDLRRLWDFTVLLFVAAAVYGFTSSDAPEAVAGFIRNATPGTQSRVLEQTALASLGLFRWLPMVFFPFVGAQACGTRSAVPWTVLSLWRRRQAARRKGLALPADHGVNVAWPYFAVCLVAASITPRRDFGFYVGFALLLAWALWFHRSRRFAPAAWAALMTLALLLGFAAQIGFFQFVRWANIYSATWLSQFMVSGFDPRETRTALGHIGRLKLSGRIVLRVTPPSGQSPPPLLREASYRFFKHPDWAGAGKGQDFDSLIAETNQTTWRLVTNPPPEASVTLAQYLTGRGLAARRGLLAVPQGIVRFDHLTAYLASTNRFGVVRVDEGPGLVIYDAHYARVSTIDAPPERDDLTTPTNEAATLAEVAAQLDLAGQTTPQVLRKLAAFFGEHFHYRLWQPPAPRAQTRLSPLARFLLHDRAGHCEYFATAATLLLREAGVPARYAVGYAVYEKSGRQYVVRQRHAHAWCLVWMDGSWRDFDVTPPSWFEAEADRASWFEFLADGWSRLWFEVSRLRYGQTPWRKYLFWVLVPGLVALFARLFIGRQWRRFRQERQRKIAAAAWPGFDSEFYLVQQALTGRALPRQPGETLAGWLERLRADSALASAHESLAALLRLHYRYRFDPLGLHASERQQLKEAAQACLLRLRGGVG